MAAGVSHWTVSEALDAMQAMRADFDLCAAIEERLRRHLPVPVTSTVWEVELWQRDDEGLPLRRTWMPGEPVPQGTRMLICKLEGRS